MLVISIAWVAQELQVAFVEGTIMREWVPNLCDSAFILDHLVSKNQRTERGLIGTGNHPQDGDFNRPG